MHVAGYRRHYVENTLLQNEMEKKEKESSSRKTNTRRVENLNHSKIVESYNNSICVDNVDEDVDDDDDDEEDDNICIKPRNCNKQIQTTIVNCKCTTTPQTNNSTNNRSGSSSNKFLNSIISILHCKQRRYKQHQHQQHLVREQHKFHHSPHYLTSIHQMKAAKTMTAATIATTITTTTASARYSNQPTIIHQQHSQKLLSHPNNLNSFSKDLIYITYNTISIPSYLLLLSCLLLLQLLPLTTASCRDEPSRSCEAICRPIWSQDNYLSTMIHPNNLTLEPFSADDYNCTIRALVLLPDDNRYLASLQRVVPILKVAVQRIHESGLLPSYVQFDWMPQDDKCDAAFATVKAMDGIVKNCAHVVFGPVCDYSLAAVGRIAKYFNSHGTPLISVGGSTFDFEKPKTKCADEFYMLLRTGMLSFETLSELTISVMKRNNWSRSIFFYDRDGQRNVAGLHTCYLMMTSLGQQMRKENMTFAQYPVTEKLANRTEEMTREIGNKHSSKWHFR